MEFAWSEHRVCVSDQANFLVAGGKSGGAYFLFVQRGATLLYGHDFCHHREPYFVVPGDSGELSGGLFSTFGNLYYYKYGIDGIDSGMSALAFWYIFIHYLQIKGVKICL